MTDLIIAAVLVLVVALALVRAKKHFKGGGCCGSGSTTIRDKKTLDAPALGEKTLQVEGMQCENCAIRVENALNRLDGVLCKVDLRKKTATVTYSAPVEDALLKTTVEKLGYQVTGIR
ncbi:MAG: heavy-metal-associated domain-containing protein [Oscillospiraceae bacterium]|nr:heavy-metal-associated domain-containing protein [Oscillospiraceae bacterium]